MDLFTGHDLDGDGDTDLLIKHTLKANSDSSTSLSVSEQFLLFGAIGLPIFTGGGGFIYCLTCEHDGDQLLAFVGTLVLTGLVGGPFWYLLWWPRTQTHSRRINPKAKFALIRTSKGNIRIELFSDEAPQTVALFENLVANAFYDGVSFYNVCAGICIVSGCHKFPHNCGSEYTISPEFHKDLRHSGPGIVSMDLSSSRTRQQYFSISCKEQPWQNDKQPVFGRVVEGQSVVNEIANGIRLKDRIITVSIEA